MTVAYTLDGGGSGTPNAPRPYRSNDDIVDRCLRWLDHEFPRNMPGHAFEKQMLAEAHEYVGDLRPSVAEVNALATTSLLAQHEKAFWLFFFTSAAYERSPEQTIICDIHDEFIGHIGYGSSKVLVNRGVVGNHFGVLSTGIVINTGTMKTTEDIGGLMINTPTGVIESAEGYTRGGLLINYGTVTDSHFKHYVDIRKNRLVFFYEGIRSDNSWGTNRVLNDGIEDDEFRGRVTGTLIEKYTDGLVDTAAREPQSILEKYGDAQKIIAKLYELAEVKR